MPLRQVATPTTLLDELRDSLGNNQSWRELLGEFFRPSETTGALHLAVFSEPYLTYILDGRKTIESRFAARRVPPYGRLCQGDVLLLKRSGGPIVGVCCVGTVWFYRLDPKSWQEIQHRFTDGLCAKDGAFWKSRERASFATLMQLSQVRRMDPVFLGKRDRRGWVVLSDSDGTMELRLG